MIVVGVHFNGYIHWYLLYTQDIWVSPEKINVISVCFYPCCWWLNCTGVGGVTGWQPGANCSTLQWICLFNLSLSNIYDRYTQQIALILIYGMWLYAHINSTLTLVCPIFQQLPVFIVNLIHKINYYSF